MTHRILPKNALTIPKHATRVFEGIIYDVYQWQQVMFDGTTQTFEMLKRPDTIEVLAIKDKKIVILEEQQPNTDVFYTPPGGRHDVAGETELDAAKRELLEETGMTFHDWRLLQVVQPHGKVEQFIYIFLAQNFEKQAPQKLDSGEKITVKLMDVTEAKQKIELGVGGTPLKLFLRDVNSIEALQNLPEAITA